jgi:hypothetical protein
MSRDEYYAYACWGARSESVDIIASRTAALLACLANVDAAFTSWFEKAPTKTSALSRQVRTNPEDLAAIIGRQVSEPLSEYGSSFGLWNGRTDPEASSFFTWWGKEVFAPAGEAPNFFRLTLPRGKAAYKRIVESTTARQILDCMIDALDPSWAVIDSAQVRANMAKSPRPVWAGWLTYIPVNSSRVPAMPEGVAVESRDVDGSIVTVTQEPLRSGIPEHVQLVAQVTTILERSNVMSQLGFSS